MNSYPLIFNPFLIRPLILKWKFNLRIFWLMSFSFIIVLVGLYIFQIAEATRFSFMLANYNQQIINSNKDFKELQINFSGSSSLSSLEAVLMSRGYEKVGKIQYIQLLVGAVAAK